MNKPVCTVLVSLSVLMAVGCSSGPREIKGTVMVDGRPVEDTRVWRDPSQPFHYDAWALRLCASFEEQAASGAVRAAGMELEAAPVKLREVSERIELLVNMRSQLAHDWNAFTVTRDEYNRRSAFIDKSILGLQLITENNTHPTVSQDLLRQLDAWSKKVDEGTVQ